MSAGTASEVPLSITGGDLSQYEQHHEKTCFLGFPTRSDTNQGVQPQKMARGLKFWI